LGFPEPEDQAVAQRPLAQPEHMPTISKRGSKKMLA